MDSALRIAGVVRESIVDGPGIRFVIFCQGCPHHCKGCHNPNTHDFDGGYDCSTERIISEIGKNPMLSGVTFSGGEPICQAKGFRDLAREIKAIGLNIIIYSGYVFEEILKMAQVDNNLMELLTCTDVIIDGPFIEDEKDLTLPFRGSRNQRPIDVKASLDNDEIIITKWF